MLAARDANFAAVVEAFPMARARARAALAGQAADAVA